MSTTFQMWMFHFRCPLCVGSSERVLLRDNLRGCSSAKPERVWQTLEMFGGALRDVQTGQSRWLTKKRATITRWPAFCTIREPAASC